MLPLLESTLDAFGRAGNRPAATAAPGLGLRQIGRGVRAADASED